MTTAPRPSGDGPRIETLLGAFRSRYGREPEWLTAAPGRVNLIGEHTDYNQGFVLPAAIDRTTLLAAAPLEGSLSRVWSANLGDEVAFDAGAPYRDGDGHWSNYVRGCAWALARTGSQVRQLEIAIESDVPTGAGLSSSAALEVAAVAALAAVSGIAISKLELARLAHRAEAEFVGVPCGIMDQFASALAEEGSALLIDCRDEVAQLVPLRLEAAGVLLVVVDSGVSRKLTGSAYRDRREECREACRLLRGPLSRSIPSLRDVTLEELALVGDQIPKTLLKRARHVVSENARVLEFVRALKGERLDDAGELMYESHRSLRDDYQVSAPELDLLVDLAGRTKGVMGARLTGAGFGGCTVNLVEESGLDRFEREVLGQYSARTGRRPTMYVCMASGGVKVSAV